MVEQTDFDGAWKDALKTFLTPAFAFFFPTIHADVDWTREVTWLDKELQNVTPEGERGPQTVDVLLQLWRKSGEAALVVVHIEIQSQPDRTFAERMFRYYSRLFDVYRRPIVSLAILGDESPNWKPDTFTSALWGCRAELVFPTVKLRDYDLVQLEADSNPFAAVVLAHRQAQATQSDPIGRSRAKVRAVTRLYQLGYNDDEVASLSRIIDRLMHLSEPLELQTWQQIREFAEARKMAYMMYPERQAYAKGSVETLQVTITRVLANKFGEDGRLLQDRIHAITDLEMLEAIMDVTATATTVDKVQELISAIPPLQDQAN